MSQKYVLSHQESRSGGWQVAATLALFILQVGLAHVTAAATATAEKPGGFYELTAPAIDGKPVRLGDFKGKLIMVVNVASRCGNTPQYKGLEELYEKNKDKGFVILGFPSNDFHAQEPGTNAEIAEFCKLNYGVKFPLFQKDHVTGDEKQAVYKFLVDHTPAGTSGDVTWNFEKFLVSPSGEVVARFNPKTKPDSDEVVRAVAEHLPGAVKK